MFICRLVLSHLVSANYHSTSCFHSNLHNFDIFMWYLTDERETSWLRNTGQFTLLYLPSQIRVPIWRKRVICRGSKLTNSLGRAKLTNALRKQRLSSRTWSVRAPWNRGQFVSQPTSNKGFLRSFFFYFWAERYNKTLNDWSCGKQWVFFPLDFNVPLV